MATSNVAICNSALIKVGVGEEGRISGLDEGSKNANVCNEQFFKLRDSLLRRHLWNFSIAREKLAKLTEKPKFEFDNAFALPSDWLRTVSVSSNDTGHGVVPYKIEAGNILSSSTDIFLRYVRIITDPNDMTVDFREVLATLLARDIALAVAQSNTIKQDMAQQYRRTMAAARSVDALEDFPEQMPQGSWTSSRNGGRLRNNSGIFV